MLRQLDIGGRFNANARAGRDIVEDHRLGAGIGNGVVHGHQAPLGGLVVIGRDHQDRVGPVGTGAFGELHRIVGLVGARAGNNRHPSIHPLTGKGNGPAVLRVGQGGALPRGAADDQGVDPLLNLPVNQSAKAVIVDPGGGGGGDQCGGNAAEDGMVLFHDRFLLHIEMSCPISLRPKKATKKSSKLCGDSCLIT